jgi:murein DD-endopeptidase MepM/ murein hydrolase activator NlpD
LTVLRLLIVVCLAVVLADVPGMARSAPVRTGASAWDWPLRPAPNEVVHDFVLPDDRWSSGHRGVDLRGRVGEEVHAAGAGVITFAGLLAGRGVVTVTHGALRTTYEPVTAAVAGGERVDKGDVIGMLDLIGGHCLPRACLHWGLLRGDAYVNPLTVVGGGPVRLLPLENPATAVPRLGVDTAPPVGRSATAPAVSARDPADDPRGSPPWSRAPSALVVVGGVVAGGVALLVLSRRRRT